MKKIIFITGGAKSGKSDFVLEEASEISGKKAYIATAEDLDEEMRKRIEEHKKKRGEGWDTYEEPLRLSEVIRKINSEYEVIIIDCLTLWLSNLIQDKCDSDREIKNLIDTLENSKLQTPNSKLFIVSNEVGMGIVPENEMVRRFRDTAGILNQKVAEISDEVYLIAAGIPVKIKG
jgi:adenosylcobinamide kinase/adenosylcobinamide-phosphate guanylyltransferase